MLRSVKRIGMFLFITGILVLAACTTPEPQIVEETVLVPQTVVVTEIVERVVTATHAAATITPLVTPSATLSSALSEPGAATPSAFVNPAAETYIGNGEMSNGLTGWCMPLGSAAPGDVDFGRYGMPATGRPGMVENGINIMHIPGEYCTLVFEFSSTIAAGGKVQVKQVHNNQSFYEVDLIPSNAIPNVGFAHLSHNYVVNPPLWGVTYLIEATDANSSVLWSGEILFQKTQPDLCWDGSTPDPVTLWCPKEDW
ncbi:MAG TPA: hypothetical protein DCK95_08080 [Anaerolineaceae bacterium]|nr:hypothetical protein [Anaerolineaceae bacterium]